MTQRCLRIETELVCLVDWLPHRRIVFDSRDTPLWGTSCEGGKPWKSRVAPVPTFTSRIFSSIPIARSGVSTIRRASLTRSHEEILLSAGISPGMRVLDVGCGAGDVTFLVSEMVGSGGQVVGADRAPAALAAAERRAAAHPIQNVSFREGDPAALSFERPFDAVIGRYVLMFQADPVAMLRGVARHLRPGGTIVFHEPDWEAADPARRRRPTTNAVDGSSRRSGAAVSRPIWVSSSMRHSARLD